MHKAGKSGKGLGFDVDNTIGSTTIQPYTRKVLRSCSPTYFLVYISSTKTVNNREKAPLLDNIIIEPCLLHRDLWSGNLSSDNNGDQVVLDPACYYGQSEAEFGMSWCAGFRGALYNGYFEVRLGDMSKQAGFEKREDLYMLYHYLNHYNLFGSGYRSSSMAIINDYLCLLNVAVQCFELPDQDFGI
ncbi:Protein-ribulosamine 3-kinase, chloroplastic [Linum perenne]